MQKKSYQDDGPCDPMYQRSILAIEANGTKAFLKKSQNW